MPTRITVRYLGSEVGKKVARPDTKGELLELAAKRLTTYLRRPCASLRRAGTSTMETKMLSWSRVTRSRLQPESRTVL